MILRLHACSVFTTLRSGAVCVWAGLAAIAAAQPPTIIKVSPHSSSTFTEALSTSFQVAPWTDSAFLAHPEIPDLLGRLNPHHVRVQVIDGSIPEIAPDVWDFEGLDRQLQPILSAADHSPELQLANAPAFLYKSKTNFVTPAFIAGYAAYAAGMVAHYNGPERTYPIRYWGILNEPNYFHISPAEYVALYNAAVLAMLAVDPNIHIIALELGGEPGDERRYLPQFVRGVTAPVDVLAVHFYSTCDQRDTDQSLFNTVTEFARQIHYIRRQLQQRAKLHAVPIWITENNLNADFIGPSGNSVCNPTQRFVEDSRGTSAFFPAWRAYEFSRFGQAGAQALFHWVFSGDKQYAEYNTEDALPRLELSYWTDLWLGRYFPSESPSKILDLANPISADLEALAVEQPESIVILIANHAVVDPTDNNALGTRRQITLDLAAFGAYRSATTLTIDSETSLTSGPTEVCIPAKPRIELTLHGYAATFVVIQR